MFRDYPYPQVPKVRVTLRAMADKRRSILITGCSSGCGLDAAFTLKARGWRVFAACRKERDCEELRDQGLESPRIDYNDELSITTGYQQVLDVHPAPSTRHPAPGTHSHEAGRPPIVGLHVLSVPHSLAGARCDGRHTGRAVQQRRVRDARRMRLVP